MQGFHVWTDNIWDETSWSDPIHHDVTGIDHDVSLPSYLPSFTTQLIRQLFWDDDDTCYLSFSTARHSPSFHMRVHTVPIDLYTGDILSSPRLAMSADLSITANDICEGPHIFKKDGVYYLITANGGTEEGHSEWVYRSEEGPMGPWVPGPTGITNGTDSGESGESKGEKGQVVNPMIYNADHPEVQNTGHMDLVEGTDGRWWAVFLGVRPRWTDELGKDGRKAPQQSQLGRETLLAPVEWVDGWPIVNRRQPISVNPSAEIAHLADLERKEERYREEWSFGPDTSKYRVGFPSHLIPWFRNAAANETCFPSVCLLMLMSKIWHWRAGTHSEPPSNLVYPSPAAPAPSHSEEDHTDWSTTSPSRCYSRNKLPLRVFSKYRWKSRTPR